MKPLTESIEAIPAWGWWTLAVLLLVGLIYHHWTYLSFTRTRLWWSLPVFGPLPRYAKNPQQAMGSTWMLGELALCSAFFGFYPEPLRLAYIWDQATAYLDKAGELGRKHFSIGGWICLTALLVVESASFGLILTDYAAERLPTLYKIWVGYSIGAVVSLLLLAATHAAGRELFRNATIRRVRDWFHHRLPAEADIPLRPYPGVSLDNNAADDGQPAYIHIVSCLNHAGQLCASYWMTALALIGVTAVGWAAFVMREAMHLKAQKELAQAATTVATPGDEMVWVDPAAVDPVIQALDSAAAHWAFIAMAAVYVLMQSLGVFVGYSYGFVSREGAAAAKIREDFKTRDEFLAYHNNRLGFVANVAQCLLHKLQQMMAMHATFNVTKDIHQRTFIQFCRARWAERDGRDPTSPAPDAAIGPEGGGPAPQASDAPSLRLIN
jgi:hypothetical protein